MKALKLIAAWLILIIFLSFLHGESWDDKFEKDPDQSWKDFEKNPTLWSNLEAREAAFKFDPKKSVELINEELAKKYSLIEEISATQDDFLIQNYGLIEILDEQIKNDENIINENPYVKREWFAQKGIFDEGAKIESFDGEIIKTLGIDATTFNIKDKLFLESKILPSGKVILKDGTSVSASKIFRDENQNLNLNGGIIEISDKFQENFRITGGKVKYNKEIFSSDDPLDLSFTQDSKIMAGKEVLKKDESGNIISKFSGSVKSNEKTFLGDSTEYTSFLNGKESRKYLVEKEIQISQGKCDDGISCIEENAADKSAIVRAVNNKVEIVSFDDSLQILSVEKIKDDSQIIFNEKNLAKITFTKEPILLEGNLAQFSTEIRSQFNDKAGETHDFFLKNGQIIQCSFPCYNIGLNSIVENRLKELRGQEREIYLKEIRDKYGNQAQAWYLDYLVINGNPRVYKGVVSASQQLYGRTGQQISPEFIYVGAVAEGLDKLISDKGVNTKEINGFFDLGLDNFGSDASTLRNLEYLPKNFIKGEAFEGGKYTVDEYKNEKGELLLSGNFENIENAFIAKTAEYAWRQDLFLKDLQDIKINKNRLSKDGVDFWTYVYYNSGQANGKQMLESYYKKGYLQNDDYIWKRPNEFWKDSHQFANKRMANLKLVKNSGIIFPQQK